MGQDFDEALSAFMATTDEGGSVKLLCVCDEDMCFCVNVIEIPGAPSLPPPDIACDECKASHHVWSSGGPRS